MLFNLYFYFRFDRQGPVFFLEDGKSAISLNDALMWAKVNPFSPLGTGIRLNPFWTEMNVNSILSGADLEI